MKTTLQNIIGLYTPTIMQLSNGDEEIIMDWSYIVCAIVLIVTVYWVFKIFYALIYRK